MRDVLRILVALLLVSVLWLVLRGERDAAPVTESENASAAEVGPVGPLRADLAATRQAAPRVEDSADPENVANLRVEVDAVPQRPDSPSKLIVHGIATRRGAPIDDAWVSVSAVHLREGQLGGKPWSTSTRTDAQGRYRFEVGPGEYELARSGGRTPGSQSTPGTWSVRSAPFHVVDSDVEIDLASDFGRVEVSVRDHIGHSVAASTVQARSRAAVKGWRANPAGEQVDGLVVFEDVPPGILELSARAEGYLPGPRSSCSVLVGSGVLAVECILERGGVVMFMLRDRSGEHVSLSDAARARARLDGVSAATGARTVRTARTVKELRVDASTLLPETSAGEMSTAQLGFQGVPTGRYQLLLEYPGSQTHREVSYGRWVLTDPVWVDVVTGQSRTCEVEVRSRAHVRVGVGAAGHERLRLRVRDTDREQRIEVSGASLEWPFEGYLPRGNYEFEFRRFQRSHKVQVRVGTEPVELHVNLPW